MAPETAVRQEFSFVARLAQFFPGAIRVRIPVLVEQVEPTQEVAIQMAPQQLITGSNGKGQFAENTVIEFGTSQEVLFASGLALDFEDRVRLKNVDGSLDTEATVVAVQVGEGKTAVAVRFTQQVANWIIKPGL